MKKIFFVGLILAMGMIPAFSFAQVAVSNSRSTAGAAAVSNPTVTTNPAANSSLNLTQTSNVPEGAGRWFMPPVQPYSPPLFPYLGPFNSGANILEDLTIFPEILTREQAKRMYKGGVSVRVNQFESYNYTLDSCKLMNSLPMRKVLATDGKPVLDKDGKQIMVPDESKFKRVAIITLKGNEEAGTADVIPLAAITAMDLGATGIVLIKKVPLSGSASSGWGIGVGGVVGQLSGQGQTNAMTGSMGTGYNRAQANPTFKESMSVLAISE